MKELNLREALEIIKNENPIKIIISNPLNKTVQYKKILIELIKDKYHVSKYTTTQVLTKILGQILSLSN